MQVRELSRTTTFRLTALYGFVFAIVTIALLGMVYMQSSAYLTRRVDGILQAHANALTAVPTAELSNRIEMAIALDADRTNIYGLFSPSGLRRAGNLSSLPAALRVDHRPLEMPATRTFPAPARLIARRLPSGDELVVGRDVSQLRQLRAIIASALLWSGVAILVVGGAVGAVLSMRHLRRLERLQAAAREIAGGDLTHRMPASHRRDELDMLADTVNHMMGEVERLMTEVKSSTDTIAHDLRTPLTRARARLHRLQNAGTPKPQEIARVTAELDDVLDRFRAILRISELEARDRHAGFSRIDPAETALRAAELYHPLAEARGVALASVVERGHFIEADSRLLFEAVSNLVDNAIKFTPQGGGVRIGVDACGGSVRVTVEDDGPGIRADERQAVLLRFYRNDRDRMAPGSGLGLSVVAAITRLHGFELLLEDAGPGLRAVIACRPPAIAAATRPSKTGAPRGASGFMGSAATAATGRSYRIRPTQTK